MYVDKKKLPNISPSYPPLLLTVHSRGLMIIGYRPSMVPQCSIQTTGAGLFFQALNEHRGE